MSSADPHPETLPARIRELKLKQLLVFERAVALGSSHKVAEVLHISQPNVHKMLVQLEALLGVQLFERSSKGLVPTVLAHTMAERVRLMLGDAQALGQALSELRLGQRGKVRVGTLISASAHVLPASIALLKARLPLIEIVVKEATNDILFPQLLAAELDVVVGRLPERRQAEVHYQALYAEKLILVTRQGHPLATSTTHDPREWAHYPWIVPTPESPVRRLLEEFFNRLGLQWPQNAIESLSMLTNVGVLRLSDTIAALPRSAAYPLIANGTLHELATDHPVVFGTVGYSVRKGRQPTAAVAAFLQALEDVGAQLA